MMLRKARWSTRIGSVCAGLVAGLPYTNAQEADGLAEVVVTATKRSESLQQVALSVTALTGEALEHKGAVNFADYARSVPALSFTDVGQGRERVSIRGVDSKIGATVVGYYLDETPIPDSSSVSAEKVAFDPELIDVDRVEVLRGPQGTVFGGGSMGGTIRIIPHAPTPTRLESSLKADLGYTDHSTGPTETVSGMLNWPIIADRLAVRMAAWVRQGEGFIHRKVATPESLAANRADGTPIDFVKVATVPSSTAVGGRLALRYLPADWLAVEASIFSDSQHYRGFQDITTGAQNPRDSLVQNFLFDPAEDNRNRLTISNLKSTAQFSGADLVTSVSYSRRLLSLREEAAAALEYAGFAPMFSSGLINEEGRDISITAETRLSSSHSAEHAQDRVQWLLGVYYTYQKGWSDVTWRVPGFSDAFGPVADGNAFTSRSLGITRQKAVFGEVSVSPVEKLKITAGARWFDFSRTDVSPQTGLFAGTPADGSIPNPYSAPTVRGTADSAVYKAAVSWQQSKGLMLYAQAAEGFRGGFGRSAIPSSCDAQAQQLGSTTAQGQVAADKLWNYEAGVKSDWLNNRLRVNLSGYRIDWTNIQQSIFLDCGFPLAVNLGSVRNTGGELEVQALVQEAWSIGGTVGYVHSALQQNIFGLPGTKGRPLPDVPQITAGAFISYDFPVFGKWVATARADYSYTDSSLSAYAVGVPFTPDKRALSLLNARLAVRRDEFEIALYGRNLLNDVERTALERDVSLNVPTRLRYAVNAPLTAGVSVSWRY